MLSGVFVFDRSAVFFQSEAVSFHQQVRAAISAGGLWNGIVILNEIRLQRLMTKRIQLHKQEQ